MYRFLLKLRREDPVLSRGAGAQLVAHAAGDLLAVTRTHGGAERILLIAFGGKPVRFGDLPSEVGVDVAGARLLFRSDEDGQPRIPLREQVPAHTAVVFAKGD
jgi:hypothetical protein